MRNSHIRMRLIALGALWLSLATLAQANPDPIPLTSQPQQLTLDQALQQAESLRPELHILKADIESGAVQLEQATTPPNPELEVEVDNLGSNRPADETSEYTVSVSQPFELGGKPLARQDKAKAALRRLQDEHDSVWLDIAAQVRTAYLEVLGARERLALLEEAERIAVALAEITQARVVAGELAATEEIRAETRRSEAVVQTMQAKRELAEAEAGLAEVMAAPNPVTVSAGITIPQEVAVPPLAALLDRLTESPLVKLRQSDRQHAAHSLALEEKNAWVDPSLSLALREIPDQKARTVALGLSVPLPIFHRNQGAIAEAEAAARKAAVNQTATLTQLQTELKKAHVTLQAADSEARTWRTEVIARAMEASAMVQEGFRLGKFRYSDVLEASKSLIDAKIRHIETLLVLNRATITIDRLTGNTPQPISTNRSTP